MKNTNGITVDPSIALAGSVEIADQKSPPNFCKSLITTFLASEKTNSKVEFIIVRDSRITELKHMYNNLSHFCRQSKVQASEGEPYALVRKVYAKLPNGSSEQIVMLERGIKLPKKLPSKA